MKYLFSSVFAICFTAIVPLVAGAQGLAQGEFEASNNEFSGFLAAVVNFMDQILIPVILALAFLMFVWGVFNYFVLGGADEDKQSKGKSLMLYAVGGFVLILSFYGIVNIIADGLGFNAETTIDTPTVPQTID